jgi:hypothetical protein
LNWREYQKTKKINLRLFGQIICYALVVFIILSLIYELIYGGIEWVYFESIRSLSCFIILIILLLKKRNKKNQLDFAILLSTICIFLLLVRNVIKLYFE